MTRNPQIETLIKKYMKMLMNMHEWLTMSFLTPFQPKDMENNIELLRKEEIPNLWKMEKVGFCRQE